MADRYWVGGSGSWNSTSKWSTTSGGPGGASVPTASDNAIFNAASGGSHYTVTVTSNATCANLTFTPVSSTGVTQFSVDDGFVITGTFSTSGTQGNRRAWFRSSTYGLMRDIQIATIGTISDIDFRDIRITGTGGTLTGTRIGDLRGCRGITFSTPKTVYWNQAAGGNWQDNAWAPTSGGTVDPNSFPLAQDIAVFENTGLNLDAIVYFTSVIPYTGTIDMSSRTINMVLWMIDFTIYGNWINGTGSTVTGSVTPGFVPNLYFSGRTTQTITSSGRTINGFLNVDSYGGSVELLDAFYINTIADVVVTNGTFKTNNYNVTARAFVSNNSNVRSIVLGSSTITLNASGTPVNFNSTNLTLDAGTSLINLTSTASVSVLASSLSLYNVVFSAPVVNSTSSASASSFNNLTFSGPTTTGIVYCNILSNTTINGTFTCSGSSPVQRIFLRGTSIGSTVNLTVNNIVATNSDFRDIAVSGVAAGTSLVGVGDCGGNSGLVFPAPKTVYWNLSVGSSANWSATGWAASSGGTPDIANFPLAQDTAAFDNSGTTNTVVIDANWNIGTFDSSARTLSLFINGPLSGSVNPTIYGDWKFNASTVGPAGANISAINFSGRSVQTITCNGATFGRPIVVSGFNTYVQLADAFSNTSTLTLDNGTFDAVSYNVTVTSFISVNTNATRTLKMGSGTWTLSGVSSVWEISYVALPFNFYKGSANIVLSDTSTSARTFAGGGLSYNKLTIGGTTGTSTLTINGDNQFTELASTKTVAHTIALGTTTQTFGKWAVTGTSGNVVTLTGTGTDHILAGACTDGIDYLAMGSIGFSASSPGEFYAGANSTGTAGAPVYRTTKPADSTRYWVGGTGNWSDTARWSTSSGGASGASVPRSHDDVVFDSASNATGYTVTVNSITGGIRTKSITIAPPASGNITLTGSASLVGIHGSVVFPATNRIVTYTGSITLSGNSPSLTFTANGVVLSSPININGVGSQWSLGSALNIGSYFFTVTNGSFNLITYNLTAFLFSSNNNNTRGINFGTGTITLSSSVDFGTTETARANLTFTSSTSNINIASGNVTFSGNNQTFYNVNFTGTTGYTVTIQGVNSFNNLSFGALTFPGIRTVDVENNQTISGTLTFTAGPNARHRNILKSNSFGTTRTFSVSSFSGTDVDFRDISVIGGAAPLSGTRLGDCKGNSGITFDTPKTVYWRTSANANWGDGGNWSAVDGGTPDDIYFPLAQDTAAFVTYPASGNFVIINSTYPIGTIDMSARTTNTMTLLSSSNFIVYGNWINGIGTVLSGTNTITFSGRNTQTITSAGKVFTQAIYIDTPGGSVILQDAFVTNRSLFGALTLTSGTLNANTYNVTLSGASSSFSSSNTNSRTVAIGSGTWTLSGTTGNVWSIATPTNLVVTGTGTISLTSSSSKTFLGGSVSYDNVTLNQGGNGSLTISGNNTFGRISSTATGSTTINIGSTTQQITTRWTALGSAGNVLYIFGSPGNLVFTGSGVAANSVYLAIYSIRAYNLDTTWYAGSDSINNGSLGWYFEPAALTYDASASDLLSCVDTISTIASLGPVVLESASNQDSCATNLVGNSLVNDTVTIQTIASTSASFNSYVQDYTTAVVSLDSSVTFEANVYEALFGQDTVNAVSVFVSFIEDFLYVQDIFTTNFNVNSSFSDLIIVQGETTALSEFYSVLNEFSTAQDGLSTSFTVTSTVQESSNALDTFAVSSATLNALFLDSAVGLDNFSSNTNLSSNILELATSSVTNTGGISYSAIVTESSTALVIFSSTFSFSAYVLEQAIATDLFAVAPSIFSAVVVGNVVSQDVVGSNFSFVVSVSEAVTALDIFSSAYLWTDVDDSQGAIWANVNNSQGSVWTDVNGSQGAIWANVNNSQGGVWTDVDDSQGSVWSPVIP